MVPAVRQSDSTGSSVVRMASGVSVNAGYHRPSGLQSWSKAYVRLPPAGQIIRFLEIVVKQIVERYNDYMLRAAFL